MDSNLTTTRTKARESSIRAIGIICLSSHITFKLRFFLLQIQGYLATHLSLCNQEGHTAPFCVNKFRDKPKCFICGNNNRTHQYYFYKDKALQFHYQPTMLRDSYTPKYYVQAMNSKTTSGISSNQALLKFNLLMLGQSTT